MFKQFKAIADGTKSDAKLLKDVLAQLQAMSNQLRQGEAPSVISAPNGIGIAGGIVTNPTVNNNTYGVPQPAPDVEWIQKPIEPRPNKLLGPLATNPGASVTITVHDIFYTPAFAVQCDRPCEATSIGVLGSASAPMLYTTDSSNIAVAALTMPSYIDAGARVVLEVRSMDSNPVRVTAVKAYVPPQHR